MVGSNKRGHQPAVRCGARPKGTRPPAGGGLKVIGCSVSAICIHQASTPVDPGTCPICAKALPNLGKCQSLFSSHCKKIFQGLEIRRMDEEKGDA